MRIGKACEDLHGYLWLGSEEGLLRFDGLQFERPVQEVFPQTNGKVTAMFCTKKGVLWAGFEDGSVAFADRMGRWQLWQLEEGLPAAPITGFAEGSDGLFWVATYGEGLYYHNGKHLHHLSTDEGMPSDDVYAIAVSPQGEIWAGTDAGIAVCSFREGRKTISLLSTAQGLPDVIVTALLPDEQGNIWIGMHDGGIALFDTRVQMFFCPLQAPWPHGVVTSLALLEGRELWIGSDAGGLFRYRLNGGHLDHINGNSGLSRSKITGLHIGAEGHLRVMTNERGFYSANLQFALLEVPEGGVQAVLADSRNRLWAGTPAGLFYGDLDATGPHKLVPYPAPGNMNVISFYEDDWANIWVGTFGQGLFVLPAKGGKWISFSELNGLSNNSILGIEGNAQKVWLATLGGVTEFEIGGNIAQNKPVAIRNYQQENGLGANFIYSAFADSKGRVWFGTDGKGISVMDAGGIKNYNLAITADRDTFPLHAIYSFSEDHAGNIWFTTAKDGLFSFDGVYFTRYDYTDGMRGKGVAFIRRDPYGLMLLAHRNGIDLLNPVTKQFLHFEEGAGISGFEPNLNAVSGDREGHIWIGAQQGILRYTPLGKQRAVHPKTVLESLSASLRPVDFQVQNRFKYDENNLVFNFSGLWYTDPERIRYRYRLIGFNKDWIYSADRKATYPNLPPGRYVFEAGAGLDDAFSPASIVQYAFRIRAPFWRQWWFILLATTAAGSAIAWWIRRREELLRREAMLKKEQVESRFEVLRSQINPHFLFNSFNTLASVIEEEPGVAVQYVERLSDFFRSIIQYRDKDVIPLEEELAVLKNYVFLLDKRHGKNLEVDIRVEETEGFIAPLSLQILVENAVKHNIVSQTKPLHVAIFRQDGFVVVENNLQPRFSPAESTGLGLRNIIRRYELLSRKAVEVEHTGTFFRVRIPLVQNEAL